MSCEQTREHLEDLELGFLDPAMAETCQRHLRTCAACRTERAAVRSTLCLLEALSDARPSAPSRRVRRSPPRLARLAVAAAAACAVFGAGLSAAPLLRPDRPEHDSRLTQVLETVAQQRRVIQELRDERILDARASRQLHDELRSEIDGRTAALARLEASSAEREASQRGEIAQLERRLRSAAGDLASCVASAPPAPPPAPVASAPTPRSEPPGPERSDEPVASVPPASAERGPALAPPGVWGATYEFMSNLIRKRETGFDDTVLAFRNELLEMNHDEE
jgi:hypothetical protein